MQINLVQTQDVDKVWALLTDGFQRALLKTGGDITIGDLWQGCRNGTSFLLIAHDGEIRGASIWRPEVWQTGTKMRCLGLYGKNMKAWFEDMRALAKQVGKSCGATSLISEGREGWKRQCPYAKVLRVLYEEAIDER